VHQFHILTLPTTLFLASLACSRPSAPPPAPIGPASAQGQAAAAARQVTSAPGDASRFWIANGADKLGPYETAALEKFIVEGRVLPSANVLPEGTAQWKPIAEVPAVNRLFRYWVQAGKDAVGPYHLADLAEYVRGGRLRDDSVIMLNGTNRWVRLRDAGLPPWPLPPPPPPVATPPQAAAPTPVGAVSFVPPNLEECSDVVLLTRYAFDDLAQGRFCSLCEGKDGRACIMDWPFNDVPPCQAYEAMMNTIYAYYGRPFTTSKWKNHFAQEPWYKADPSYRDSRLSPMARRNVEFLRKKARSRDGCL
jgi:hypothetical protein